jgi:NADH:ubiquinone oxidoreductase subunit
VQEKTAEEERRAVLQREKEEATAKGEPWVGVLDTQVNPDNIKNGFFELDWNNEFIEQLLDAGYSGESNEEIVNGWFRTIAMQILDEEGLDNDREMGYINVKPIDKDKSEVS